MEEVSVLAAFDVVLAVKSLPSGYQVNDSMSYSAKNCGVSRSLPLPLPHPWRGKNRGEGSSGTEMPSRNLGSHKFNQCDRRTAKDCA